MPRRLIVPMAWLHRHVRNHPGRLATTAIVLLLVSLALLGFALNTTWDAARQGRIDQCIAINELSRKIYVTLGDFHVPQHERAKYLPSQDCESIP